MSQERKKAQNFVFNFFTVAIYSCLTAAISQTNRHFFTDIPMCRYIFVYFFLQCSQYCVVTILNYFLGRIYCEFFRLQNYNSIYRFVLLLQFDFEFSQIPMYQSIFTTLRSLKLHFRHKIQTKHKTVLRIKLFKTVEANYFSIHTEGFFCFSGPI